MIEKYLLSSTNLNENEVIQLYKKYKSKFKKFGGMTRSEFLDACSAPKSASFYAIRLFEIFYDEARSRTANGMDFEAFLNAVSSMCARAPLEERLFVCFKIFDVEDQNFIFPNQLRKALSIVLKDSGKQIEPAALDKVVESAFIEAGCSVSHGMGFIQFKKLFLKSPILRSQFINVTKNIDYQPSNIFSFSGKQKRGSFSLATNENINQSLIKCDYLLKKYKRALGHTTGRDNSMSPRNLSPVYRNLSLTDDYNGRPQLSIATDSFSSCQISFSGDEEMSPKSKPQKVIIDTKQLKRSSCVDPNGRRHSSSVVPEKRSRLLSIRRLSDPVAQTPKTSFFEKFFKSKAEKSLT